MNCIWHITSQLQSIAVRWKLNRKLKLHRGDIVNAIPAREGGGEGINNREERRLLLRHPYLGDKLLSDPTERLEISPCSYFAL